MIVLQWYCKRYVLHVYPVTQDSADRVDCYEQMRQTGEGKTEELPAQGSVSMPSMGPCKTYQCTSACEMNCLSIQYAHCPSSDDLCS